MQHSLAFTPPKEAPRHLPPLDAERELYWLALTLVPGLGPRRGRQLIERFGDIRSAFGASREELEQCGLSGTLAQSIASGCTFDEAVEQQNRARALGVAIVPMEDPRYPAALREINEAPLVLFGRGNIGLLLEPSIAIVGTRRPSSYGKSVSERLSRDLSALGFIITSGMARGIDTYAHRGTLAAGGATIAVFGSGVDVIYPAENKALAD